MTDSEVVNGWMEETRERMELAKTRQLLLRLLRSRFTVPLPADFVRLIKTQESQDVLDNWFDAASRLVAMSDFIRMLKT